MSTTLANLQQVNSTSYVDVLGLSIGLSRLPGEGVYAFALRIAAAASRSRTGHYQGALAELSVLLGLKLQGGITLTSTDPGAVLMVGLSSLVIIGSASANAGSTALYTVPLLQLSPDNLWVWCMLSDVVAKINESGKYEATLTVPDAQALQIANQTNQFYFHEPVLGQVFHLSKLGFLANTISFDQTVMPTYTLSGQTMTFATPPPEGANVYYQYLVWPFDLTIGEAGLMSLTDPAFSSIAAASDGTLVQQVGEILQTIVTQDRSYWAK